MSISKPNTLIIGAGLIGTSIAMGLIKSGYKVFLADQDNSALKIALEKSGASALPTDALPADAMPTDQADDLVIDLVIVATPPSKVADVIKAALKEHPVAVITDVASVKGVILNALTDLTQAESSRIVGGHPMAGREVTGATGAQNNLFVDRSWVITKLPNSSETSIQVVKQLISDLGAVPIERAIEEHDQAVALISHTPQVIASVLAGELLNADPDQVALAGQGLRDQIRIASSDPKLWTEILSGNAQYVSKQLAAVAGALAQVAKSLEAGDEQAITAMLTKGSSGRDRLPGKHGAAQKLDSQVVVRLEDKPGELARLFTVAASANVNLEDVRIDHSLGRMTGLVELTVAQENRDVLINALTSADFVVVN